MTYAAPTSSLLTEADFFDDQPIVLSASRLSQPLKDAPAAVTVIDEDMIRASGSRAEPLSRELDSDDARGV